MTGLIVESAFSISRFSPAAICYQTTEIPVETFMAGHIAHVNMEDSRLNKYQAN